MNLSTDLENYSFMLITIFLYNESDRVAYLVPEARYEE